MNDLRSELRMAHPRPDFTREHWHSLDGMWAFAFDDADVGLREGWQSREDGFPLDIRVPFPYQSEMSGIGTAEHHPVMWYQRPFEAPAHADNQRVLLHFGAVDYACRVYVNGQMVAKHRGGYLPFSADITPALRPGRNSLSLRVVDTRDTAQPRGKQYWDDGLFLCWYTPCSGIWQSVYMEVVGDTALRAIYVTPDINRCLATVEVNIDHMPGGDLSVDYDLYFEGRPVRSITSSLPNKRYELAMDMRDGTRLDSVRLWTPDKPNLYDLVVTLRRGNQVLDRVATYFGLRSVSTQNGHVLLNNMPIYQRLVLNQGYWPQSLMTPPDNATLKKDVELIRALGFNGVRMHQKIEDPRFYYWCDRLGLLCWGEVPSAFEFCRDEVVNLTETMTAFIQRDYNHPSIIVWVPLNESWGAREIYAVNQQQRLCNTLFQLCKAMDPTRLVIGNDGWEQVYTDIVALHDYAAQGEALAAHFGDREQMEKGFADWRMTYARDFEPEDGPYDEPVMITEYGGIAMTIKGQQGRVDNMEAWGYNDKVDSEEAFLARFRSLTDAIRALPYCRGYCYTQLTDVMQEINGLLTPDREPKIDPALFARYNGNPEGYGRPGAE